MMVFDISAYMDVSGYIDLYAFVKKYSSGNPDKVLEMACYIKQACAERIKPPGVQSTY